MVHYNWPEISEEYEENHLKTINLYSEKQRVIIAEYLAQIFYPHQIPFSFFLQFFSKMHCCMFEIRQEKICRLLTSYQLLYVYFLDSVFVTLGPYLPTELRDHSMVPLGLGQAILGGKDGSGNHQKKIYFMTCSNRNCFMSTLTNELSHPLSYFVAIPISDQMAGCISQGKMLNFGLTSFSAN